MIQMQNNLNVLTRTEGRINSINSRGKQFSEFRKIINASPHLAIIPEDAAACLVSYLNHIRHHASRFHLRNYTMRIVIYRG
ncbi:hypothetical protein D3C77_346490 [compost metagenome]